MMMPNQITAHNAGWVSQFRFAVHVAGRRWRSFFRLASRRTP